MESHPPSLHSVFEALDTLSSDLSIHPSCYAFAYLQYLRVQEGLYMTPVALLPKNLSLLFWFELNLGLMQ